MKKYVTLSVFLLIVLMDTAAQEESTYFKSIIGAWYEEADSSVRWVFESSGTCIWYRRSDVIARFTYQLADVSEACGIDQSSSHFKALRLIEITATSRFQYNDQAEATEDYCYHVNGITDEFLSLTPESGGVYVLKKQNQPTPNRN